MLKESLESFIAPVYGKTRRSAGTYTTLSNYYTRNIVRLLEEYKTTKNDAQLLREMRNDLDKCIRRYHEYCIEQRDGMLAHYHEVGADDECDFEHLIPLKIIRDLLLAGKINVQQALNAPTVRLSRAKHKMLKDAGWATATPNMWIPFERYINVFDAQYTTYDGTAIDPSTWTLDQHYSYFKHLVI